MDKSTDLRSTRRANYSTVGGARSDLGSLSPREIMRLRADRKLTEADLDEWTDWAARAILRTTDGRHL